MRNSSYAPIALAAGLLCAMGLPAAGAADAWPCFRGPAGNNSSDDVPAALPAGTNALWRQPLSGTAYSGIVAADGCVVVADNEDNKRDLFRCFKADTGAPLWTFAYENTGDPMDYGSCPRATPAIDNGRVFTLGARGQLHALDLHTGAVVWKKNLASDFGAELPGWGYCASPIVVDGRLIVNPGAPARSIVALDPRTGSTAWASPGGAANYGSYALTAGAGGEELVCCDQENLVGRAVRTGKVLWSKSVDNAGGYIVPTPVAGKGQVVMFDDTGAHGMALPAAAAPDAWEFENADLVPGDGTPSVLGDMIVGTSQGKGLMALDLTDKLKTLWTYAKEDGLDGFANVIVGNGRALVLDANGDAHLLALDKAGCKPLGKRHVCGATQAAPALAGGRFYVREEKAVMGYAWPSGAAEGKQ